MQKSSARESRPNLRHLRAFSLAVSEGNISKAASKAHITQSAVSQAVAKLERLYGCKLLERGASGVFPTEMGKVAAHRIDRALERLSEATNRVCAPQAGPGSVASAIARKMSLSQLAAFGATADGGGYRAGAGILGISQPSVHRAVRQLQDVMGRPLLERTSRGFAPTRAGAFFATAVALILKEIDLVAVDLADARGQHRGRVAIGSLALGRPELVPRAVARVVKSFPHADFLIQDGTYGQLLQGLRAGDLDLIVTAGRPIDADDVSETLLFDDALAVVARADHPLASGGIRSLRDLRNYPWILPRAGTPTRRHCDNLLARIGGTPPGGLIETGALASVRGLLLESDRLTVLSRRQIAVELKAGLLAALDIPLPALRRPIVATTRRDWKPTRVQAAVLAEIEAIAREWHREDSRLFAPGATAGRR